ncbi:MAG: hypothetical protein KJ048_15520 [Dehalococcoidia bacterium]|nr:hypothetical protein [Dehalococcoidia bacterium]
MRRSYRPLRRIALAGLAALALAFGPACGDDDDTAPADAGGTPTTAADLLPDLSADGFALVETGRVPGAAESQDAHFAIYAKQGAISQARVEVNMHSTPDAATDQFNAISEALRNPPPDLFGPNATQADSQAVFQGDQSRSYVTTKPDGQGNLVYTDAYRFGRAVVIVYLISNDPAAAAEARKDIAEKISAAAD